MLLSINRERESNERLIKRRKKLGGNKQWRGFCKLLGAS